MLEVLRSVRPGVGSADAGEVALFGLVTEATAVLTVGTDGVDCVDRGFGVGRLDAVTDRVCGFEGVAMPDPADVLGRLSGASLGRPVLDLATGSAGSGPVGGLARGGRGRVEVIEIEVDMSQACKEPGLYNVAHAITLLVCCVAVSCSHFPVAIWLCDVRLFLKDDLLV